jgi:butyryl-CoA dehydrogenase
LLDILTPVVKSWPAKYGCTANEMAMQVLGGAGYTREYPLEQIYRDQRLNPIHEGAEAIHGLDLLGRKVAMNDGKAFCLFCRVVTADLSASREHAALQGCAAALQDALGRLIPVTAKLVALQQEEPDLALANATLYLDAFGRVTAAWMWLKQATVASRALTQRPSTAETNYYQGKLQTAHYYFRWELPAATAQFALLASLDRTPLDMKDEWFQ